MLCVCGVGWGRGEVKGQKPRLETGKQLLCISFIKPTYAHLTYRIIQSLVCSYIVWWNSTFRNPVGYYLKLHYNIYSSNTLHIIIIYAAKLKNVRSHKMWLKFYMLVYCCRFHCKMQTSNLFLLFLVQFVD